MYAYLYTYTHSHTHTHVRTPIGGKSGYSLHTYIFIYIYTRIYISLYVHTLTHTHTCRRRVWRNRCICSICLFFCVKEILKSKHRPTSQNVLQNPDYTMSFLTAETFAILRLQRNICTLRF